MIVHLARSAHVARLVAYVTSPPGAVRLGGTLAGRNAAELTAEIELVAALHPSRRNKVRHLAARLPPDERLADRDWCAVAERLLASLGCARCPTLIYRHADAAHGHMHALAGLTSYAGESADPLARSGLARIKYQIERDYGLRPTHSPGVAGPAVREVRFGRAPDPVPLKRRLQAAVAAAARAATSFAGFLAELDRRGVEAFPHLGPGAAIHGLAYRLAGYTYSDHRLGALFRWRDLERLRGWHFDPAQDLPLAIAAHDRFLARHGQAPPASHRAARAAGVPFAPPPTTADRRAGAPGAGSAWPAGPRLSPRRRPEPPPDAASVAARHLAALGPAPLDLLVLDPASGRTRELWPDCARDRLLAHLPRLLAGAAAEILIRPAPAADLILLTGVHSDDLCQAERLGCEAAAVVAPARARNIRREVWLRAGAAMPRHGAERRAFAAAVARALRVPPPAAAAPFGHLAGLPTPLVQRLAGAATPPVALLLAAPGTPFRRAAALAAAAHETVRQTALAERVTRELAAIHAHPAVPAGPNPPFNPSLPTLPPAPSAATGALDPNTADAAVSSHDTADLYQTAAADATASGHAARARLAAHLAANSEPATFGPGTREPAVDGTDAAVSVHDAANLHQIATASWRAARDKLAFHLAANAEAAGLGPGTREPAVDGTDAAVSVHDAANLHQVATASWRAARDKLASHLAANAEAAGLGPGTREPAAPDLAAGTATTVRGDGSAERATFERATFERATFERAAVDAAVLRLSLARDRLAQARAGLAASHPLPPASPAAPAGPLLSPRDLAADLQEVTRQLAAGRRHRRAERTVEDLLGLDSLPPRLALGDLAPYVQLRATVIAAADRWQATVAAASHPAAPGQPPEPRAARRAAHLAAARDEAAIAYRALHRNLVDFAAEHRFYPVLPADVPPPPPAWPVHAHPSALSADVVPAPSVYPVAARPFSRSADLQPAPPVYTVAAHPPALAADPAPAPPAHTAAAHSSNLPPTGAPPPSHPPNLRAERRLDSAVKSALDDHNRATRRLASLHRAAAAPPIEPARATTPDRPLAARGASAPGGPTAVERRLRTALGARIAAERALEAREWLIERSLRRNLDAARIAAPSPSGPPGRATALGRASALAGAAPRLSAECCAALHRHAAQHLAALVRQRLSRDLNRLAAVLAVRPGPAELGAAVRLLEAATAAAPPLPRRQPAVSAARLVWAQESFTAAAARLLAHPGTATCERFYATGRDLHALRHRATLDREARGLRQARAGLRRTGRDLRAGRDLLAAPATTSPISVRPQPSTAALPCQDLAIALGRLAAAESTVALRLDSSSLHRHPAALPTVALLDRAWRGDLTAETLTHLARSVATSPEVPAASPTAAATSPQARGTSPETPATLPTAAITSREVLAAWPTAVVTSPEASAASPTSRATSPAADANTIGISANHPTSPARTPDGTAANPTHLGPSPTPGHAASPIPLQPLATSTTPPSHRLGPTAPAVAGTSAIPTLPSALTELRAARAGLLRAIRSARRAAGGVGTAPSFEPRQPPDRGHAAAHRAGDTTARSASRPGEIARIPRPAPDRSLRTALYRYQAAVTDIHRQAVAPLLTARDVLPLTSFLAHPELRQTPADAVLAWATHAARRGVPPDMVAACLAHAVPPGQAPPLHLATAGSRLAARLGADHAATLHRIASQTRAAALEPPLLP